MDFFVVGLTLPTVTNRRSVGTNSGTLYSTGTALMTENTCTVIFAAGASLPTNVGRGDKLTIGSTVFHIWSRDSATQATVYEFAPPATVGAYKIKRAYNDFQSWETARQGDLVAQDRIEVAVAYDDGDFTSGLTIDGSTTDSTHYMEVYTASGESHLGVAGPDPGAFERVGYMKTIASRRPARPAVKRG